MAFNLGKARRRPEEPQLSWLRDLPEVGEPIRRMVDDEEKRLAHVAKLRRELDIELGEIQVLRERAIGEAKAQWRADEIRAARGRR